MAALREILIAFGVNVDTKPIDSANKKTDDLIKKVEKFATALAGVLVVKRLVSEAFDLAHEATELEHLSEATGLSTHELQAWELGAKEAGVEGEGFTMALRKLAKELAGGTAKNQSKILKEYGLTALQTKTHAITLSEALPLIAEKFKAMADGPAKSAKATELFGRQGARLIPLLNKGAAGIVQLKKELDDLGGGFSPEFIKQSVEVEKQQERLGVAWTSLKVRIFGLLLPAVLAGVNMFIKAAKYTSDLIDRTHLLGSAIAVLGTILVGVAASIVVAYAPVILPFVAWAAAIAAVILIAEDLYGFFTGKNSLIGEAIDAAFGDGSQQKVRDFFKAIWDFGKEAFGALKDIFGDTTKSFSDRLDAFLDYLGGGFATHFTGSFGEIMQDIVAIFQTAIDGIEFVIDQLVWAAKQAGKLLGIGQDDDTPAPDDTERTPEERAAAAAPLTTEDIDSAFAPDKPAKKGKAAAPLSAKTPLSRKDIHAAFAAEPSAQVPVPQLPGSWGDSPWAPVAPVVNQNFAIPPGTPAQQQRAIAAAAEHGTTKALTAPNRAASNAVSRSGAKP